MVRQLMKEFSIRTLKLLFFNYKQYNLRCIASTSIMKQTEADRHSLIIKDHFFDQEEKNKETFLNVVDFFSKKNYKTGHVEFIYAALKRMKEFGVDEDLEVYKKLIDVMPKGKMVTSNSLLNVTMYYPKHQFCIVELLMQMEEKRVMPDKEIQELLIRIFGRQATPTVRLLRMMYWLPKLKYASPWPPPEPRPKNAVEVAKLGVKRMCSMDLETEINLFNTVDDELSTEYTWIVNGQSPMQRKLLEYHPENLPIYVEGGFKMYLGRKDTLTYFILRADPPKNRRRKKFNDPDVIKNLKIPFFDPPTPEDLIPDFSVHEQRDGIIYAVGVTGTSSKNSLLSWIRFLEKNGNSKLKKISIVFKDTSPLGKVQCDNLIISGEEN